MLKDRMRGLLTLHTMAVLLALTIWFPVLALLTDAALGVTLLFQQINFVLYELGIAAGLLFSFAFNQREAPWARGKDLWIESVRYTNKHMLVVAIVVLGIIWATKDKAISRQFVALYMGTGWLLLLLLNRYLFAWLGSIFFRGSNNVRTVIVGSGSISQKLMRWMENQDNMGVKVVGLVVPLVRPDATNMTGLPILGEIGQLDSILQQSNAGQIILIERSKYWMDTVLQSVHRRGCRLLIFNHWEEYFAQPLTVVNQGELTFFTIGEEPLQNPVNRVVKRVLDIAFALPVALLILPPLALATWVAHKLQSPGPLLYRQVRTGHGQRPFSIYKFRTLHMGDGPAEMRRFALGNLLRRTSLDEMPQFFNVLQGHMSVVGPRPHMVADDELFARFTEFYRDRHFVKPGITGLAQQAGFRGEVKTAEDLDHRIQLDLDYIRNWSAWLDIGIVLRTTAQIILPPRSAR